MSRVAKLQQPHGDHRRVEPRISAEDEEDLGGTFLSLFSRLLPSFSSSPSPSLSRFSRLIQVVAHTSRETFRSLNSVVDSLQNYKNYRDLLRRSVLPCLPYFGIFLRDLTFTDVGMYLVLASLSLSLLLFSLLLYGAYDSCRQRREDWRQYQLWEDLLDLPHPEGDPKFPTHSLFLRRRRATAASAQTTARYALPPLLYSSHPSLFPPCLANIRCSHARGNAVQTLADHRAQPPLCFLLVAPPPKEKERRKKKEKRKNKKEKNKRNKITHHHHHHRHHPNSIYSWTQHPKERHLILSVAPPSLRLLQAMQQQQSTKETHRQHISTSSTYINISTMNNVQA